MFFYTVLLSVSEGGSDMTFTSLTKRFAALLLAASLLLALGACGSTSTSYSVDRSPETSFEASASPAGGESTESAEPSYLPESSGEPSAEPEVSASPEASEPTGEVSPDPDEAPSPDDEPSESPAAVEPASAEPSPDTGTDEEPKSSSEAPSGAAAEPSGVETSPEDTSSSGVRYVLNTNTMKFHLPYCSSVEKIKAKNRLDSSESREAIIAKGYVPCKICDP